MHHYYDDHNLVIPCCSTTTEVTVSLHEHWCSKAFSYVTMQSLEARERH